MNPRWMIALGCSLLLHTGAAVGTVGWRQTPPSFEATPGEAKVAVVFRSKPTPPRASLNIEPVPQKKVAEPVTALSEVEGVEATAPRSFRNPPPPYPPEAFRRGIQGVTSLWVEVNPQGRAFLVVMESSSGSVILDEVAASAVAKWIFIPARRAGIPVSGSIRIRIRFQIVEAEEWE